MYLHSLNIHHPIRSNQIAWNLLVLSTILYGQHYFTLQDAKNLSIFLIAVRIILFCSAWKEAVPKGQGYQFFTGFFFDHFFPDTNPEQTKMLATSGAARLFLRTAISQSAKTATRAFTTQSSFFIPRSNQVSRRNSILAVLPI